MEGGNLKPASSGAPRLKGMVDGAEAAVCLETIEMRVVMGIDKATHVREGQCAETERLQKDMMCADVRPLHRSATETPPVCGKWGDIVAGNTPPTLQFDDNASPRCCCNPQTEG